MDQTSKASRSAASGRIPSAPLGEAKARRFAAVEGLFLDADGERTKAGLELRGLNGDAYRKAVAASFRENRA
jgi:hypothetical protein